jgi:hypothetical protein
MAAAYSRDSSEHGTTGTVADILIAKGCACSRRGPRGSGHATAQPDAPDPVVLLDEAITLLLPLPRNIDAVLALANNRLARVRLTAAADPARAMTDLIETESQLRPHAANLQFAQQLGQALDLQVVLSLASEPDPDVLIRKELEAVELVRRAPYGFGGIVTIEIYERLLKLLDANGRTAQATAARIDAAEVWRLRQDGSPHTALPFAGLLTDLAVAIHESRPLEALNLRAKGHAAAARHRLQPVRLAWRAHHPPVS